MPSRSRSWGEAVFGELVAHSAFGPRFPGSAYAEDGNVATLRTTDLDDDGRISYETMPLAHLNEDQFANHLLATGDLVITRSGTCGIAAVFEGFGLPVLPGAFLIRFRMTERADPRFYRYYFNSPNGRSHILSVARGAVQQNLNITNVETLRVPLPPLSTQNRIVELLSAYDDLIENNRRRMALLEDAARQLYREWFVRLRFPGHEHTRIAHGLPEGWERMSIGGVAANFDRLRVPLSVFEREARPGNYPYHGAAGVLDHIDGYLFDGRYLLVGEDGTVQTQSGTPMLQLVEGKFWVSNHAHVLSGNIISTEFLYCLLSFYPISGHVTGVAQPKLTQANLNRIPVLVPTRLLREEFQDVVAAIFTQHFVLQGQNQKLSAARDLLLPRLVSGEIAV